MRKPPIGDLVSRGLSVQASFRPPSRFLWTDTRAYGEMPSLAMGISGLFGHEEKGTHEESLVGV